MRPVGVEPLEDTLQRVIANSWPVVIDDDLDSGFHATAGDPHLAASIGKRLGVDQQIRDHLAEPGIMARYRERIVGGAAFEADLDGDVMTEFGFVGDRGQRGEQTAYIDRRHVLPLQFGVEAACIRDVGNQPVEPLDVVLDHREQPRAAVLVARQGQRFDCRAQRRQRVLQFMGDVGGEHLDRLDAVIERVGHVAQRAGEMADLVAAAGEIGNLDAGANAATHPLGAVGEPAYRSGDGAG